MELLTLHMQLEELNKGKLININEESSCNKKDEDVPGKMTTAKIFTLK